MIKNFQNLFIKITLTSSIIVTALLSASSLSYAIELPPVIDPCLMNPMMPGCPGFIPIIIPPVPPHTPVASNLDGEAIVNTNEDTAVTDRNLSGSDSFESHTLTYVKVTDPSHGTVTNLNASTGNFTYTPDLNYFGEDSFTYKVNDGTADSNIANVSINVDSVNDFPVMSLIGASTIDVIVGTEYTELGATCTDVEDGVIVVGEPDITGEVKFNTESANTFTASYRCWDSSEQEGSTVTVNRIINVIPVPAIVVPEPVTTYGSLIWTTNPSTPKISTNTNLQVLGASTSCGISVNGFLRRGYANDVESVKKLQNFLNDYLKINLEATGVFDINTENALKNFQKKHATEILNPWGITEATGIFYLTTRVVINNIMCPALKMQMPTVLVPMSSKRNA